MCNGEAKIGERCTKVRVTTSKMQQEMVEARVVRMDKAGKRRARGVRREL